MQYNHEVQSIRTKNKESPINKNLAWFYKLTLSGKQFISYITLEANMFSILSVCQKYI